MSRFAPIRRESDHWLSLAEWQEIDRRATERLSRISYKTRGSMRREMAISSFLVLQGFQLRWVRQLMVHELWRPGVKLHPTVWRWVDGWLRFRTALGVQFVEPEIPLFCSFRWKSWPKGMTQVGPRMLRTMRGTNSGTLKPAHLMGVPNAVTPGEWTTMPVRFNNRHEGLLEYHHESE